LSEEEAQATLDILRELALSQDEMDSDPLLSS
jgi:hypothetical protein